MVIAEHLVQRRELSALFDSFKTISIVFKYVLDSGRQNICLRLNSFTKELR